MNNFEIGDLVIRRYNETYVIILQKLTNYTGLYMFYRIYDIIRKESFTVYGCFGKKVE